MIDAHDDTPVEIHLQSHVTEVRRARHFAASTLEGWGFGDVLVQDVITIVSELATNAIIHGQPPVCVRVSLGEHELVIEVEDALATVPEVILPGPRQSRGRGLRIVAQLSEHWDAIPSPTGKTVRCSVALND